MNHQWRTRATAHVLGDDVPHDGGIMTREMVQGRITDPAQLIPHLFRDHDAGLMARVKPGDFIVAGRNFGCGKPHTNGYIALQALGIRVLCASAPASVARSMMNVGLAALDRCEGIAGLVRDGDEIEVDFVTGEVVNRRTGTACSYPPMSPHVRTMIEQGGREGLLKHWLREHPELAEPWPGDEAPAAGARAAARTIPIVPGERA
jgi:3-isopropylmalate/(R)-2-methylmalate dehydratase small subunit